MSSVACILRLSSPTTSPSASPRGAGTLSARLHGGLARVLLGLALREPGAEGQDLPVAEHLEASPRCPAPVAEMARTSWSPSVDGLAADGGDHVVALEPRGLARLPVHHVEHHRALRGRDAEQALEVGVELLELDAQVAAGHAAVGPELLQDLAGHVDGDREADALPLRCSPRS